MVGPPLIRIKDGRACSPATIFPILAKERCIQPELLFFGARAAITSQNPRKLVPIPMRPLLHPTLLNGQSGDPAVYVETLFERRAILFDLGDISVLPPRKIHRLDQVFVSHTHIDHFVGFDQLLRVLVGREKMLRLYGPQGFIGHVHHKLQGYRWNLVDRYLCDLVFAVTEIDSSLATRTVRFRLKNRFEQEEVGEGRSIDGVIHSEPGFWVSTALLEHRTPCLAFAIEEDIHVNVWKNRLAELRLPVGPWLRELKRAVIENRPDDYPICIGSRAAGHDLQMPLGALRGVLTVTPGQKIAYVTDAADTAANREAIIKLARGADLLFIEAAFAQADSALAAERAHLTTAAAGRIARAAGVRRIEPFHFSPRYAGQEQRLLAEVMAAFAGVSPARAPA
jgi:ribonuclease Z